MTNLPAHQLKLSDIIAEYDQKLAAVDERLAEFQAAAAAVKTASTICGTFGNVSLNTGYICDRDMKASLLKSAWRHTYNGLNIETIAPASDKDRFERELEAPPPFTLENIRATFGDYVVNPRQNILRGLAEAFCDLDDAYKSHDRMKIGVKGLPKRVIIQRVGGYGNYGTQRLKNILNALAAYQRKPLVEWQEINAIKEDGDALKKTRGVWLKIFGNGNGHLFFDQHALKDINMALAEYYGDVLPDCAEAKPEKPTTGAMTVAGDLQYYPTPQKVVETVMNMVSVSGLRVLEPSCGCGRFLDAIRKAGGKAVGIEVDAGRAHVCRTKGHAVQTANFLECTPDASFDVVIMNPPFYGTHYAKHVEHAMKFLKPRGELIAILPATARYDHGILQADNWNWRDLPVGSFSESGTNVNTTIYKARKQ